MMDFGFFFIHGDQLLYGLWRQPVKSRLVDTLGRIVCLGK